MAGNTVVAARMRKAAALMARRGLKVQAMAGWATRGRSATFSPRAVLLHHTAAAVDVDRILRDGRGDLPGPLCNWALHADGTWVLVASGRANHAGIGTLANGDSFGIEATGPNHPRASGATAFDNYHEYVAGVACLLEAEGWSTDRVLGHKETARPVGRKVDPAFGMEEFRRSVQRALTGGSTGKEAGLMGVEFKDKAELEAFIQDAVYGPGKATPRVEGTVNAKQVVEAAVTAARAASERAGRAVAAVNELTKRLDQVLLHRTDENPTGKLP